MTLPNDTSPLVEGLNQVPKQEFLSALSRVYEGHGTAIVFIEQHILSALSRLGIATRDFGRDKGVVGVFPFQNDINYVSADNVVYILNPDLSSMRSLVVHLLSYTQRFASAKPTILYVPQKTLIAEQVMEDEFKLSHTFPSLRIASLDLDYVFLEEKFFTMTLPLSFKSVFADGDLSNLTWIARLLLKLQTARFGAIRHIRGKGSNAARVIQLLQRMQNNIGHDFITDIPSEVETLIIIDRSVDFVTPLMTQLTYEGLIDELYDIENCEVQFPFSLGESSGVGASEKVVLNSTDRMFAEIRDRSFTGVGSVLYQKSIWVKQNYDKRKEVQQLKELKEFMKGLPEMQEMHRLIGIHTNVATEISKTTQSTDFRKRILFEHNIIQQTNEGDVLRYIEDLVFRKEKFEVVLRLLALLSLVNSGLREKDLLSLKENMMLVYGIPHVITTFFLLERCGLLCAQSGKGSSYPTIRKQLQTWNSSVPEGQPNDIAYAYGGYAPPFVRMVDTLLRNPQAWDAEDDAPSLLPGEKKELMSDVEIAGTTKTAIVFVIGGITASEVSALRFVEERLSSGGRPHRIFIGTTGLISGNRMIRSLLPFEPTRAEVLKETKTMGEGRIRCYYEVLEVERKATYDEIRAAYKKKSLQYHPDKNYGNQEEAAMRFKEVQNAYSILSDADERAWYDSHREAILRGGDGTGDLDELNLYEYFTAGCFDGFDDGESGFYTVYRKVFDILIEEESDYDSHAKLWPGFGTSTSDWADVQKFYGHWRNFSTYKTFTWKDEYKVNEMEDRYSRRMAGRINSKARDGAKKEYVRTVQSLSQFVYRRDPRVKAELERQEEEEQAKREKRERQEIERLKRRREANERVWAEAAERESREEAERAARGEAMDGSILEMLYEKERQTKEMMRGNGGVGAHTAGFAMLGGDDEEVVTVFNCPACKKQFKSENQYKEHVRSNKHKTKLKQLAAKGTDVAALMGEKVEGSRGGTEE